MAHNLPLPPPGFDDLSVQDQLDYIESLWDRIAANPEQVPLPDWHRQVLDERLAAHETNPIEGKPWDEVREEMRTKLSERKSRR